jgi:hypothetical protein
LRLHDLRAHPGSLDTWGSGCSKSPEHDADHGETNEGSNGCGVTFEIASQAAIAADPGKGAFHNPSLGQDLEAGRIRSLHDLQPPCSCAPGDERHLRACVSAISKDALDERKHLSRPTQQEEGSISVLNISRMHNDAQQEAQRVDQDVPLAAFDLLARVVARRIERRPPF